MMALADWVTVIDAHDAKYGEEPRAVLELQPSEIDRLRHDLLAAREAIEAAGALIARYATVLEHTRDTLDRYKNQAEKAMDLARKFSELELEPDSSFAAPSEPVNVKWVYRAPSLE